MTVATLENSTAKGLKILEKFRFKVTSFVPATNFQLADEHGPLIFANPAGAINLKLPLITEANAGALLIIVNPSAFTITVKDSTAASTIGTIITTNTGIYVNDGTTWYEMLFPLS